MRRRLTVAVFLLASAPPLCAAQTRPYQPPRDTVVHEGTAIIKGRIVEAGTSQPVRKVRVHAASPALKDGRTTYTDANGAFELTALPAGHYVVTANKAGFVPTAFGQMRPLDAGAAIDVADGKTIASVDFPMSRAGVIAGRITDEFGEPLADTAVSAMRYQLIQGTRRLQNVATRRTNDIGEFRLFGLGPGQYYLSATLQDNSDQANGNAHEVYAPTYYPGTPNAGTAQPLTIGIGQTMSGMNMMLLPARSVNVTGTVSDSSGRPLVNSMVMANLRVGLPGAAKAAPVRAGGAFTLSGLSAGEYILHVRNVRMDAGFEHGESAALPLTVGAGDISDVHIVTSPPTSVTGRVHVDPAELGSMKGSTFHLSSPPATEEDIGISGGANATVKDDFTFELKIPPGRVFIRSNTAGWFLRAVRIGGVDVIDSGVEIQPNATVSGVEIELTHKQPEVTGVVRTAAGDATRSAYVLVFPQDPQKWGYLSRYVRMGRPNPDNQYRILVPPGEYFAVALDFISPGDQRDPDFIARQRDRAVAISLKDGDHKTLDLNLLPASPQ